MSANLVADLQRWTCELSHLSWLPGVCMARSPRCNTDRVSVKDWLQTWTQTDLVT